jgi:hypothetical protein
LKPTTTFSPFAVVETIFKEPEGIRVTVLPTSNALLNLVAAWAF